MKRGFDCDVYVVAQKEAILERIHKFGRLYLEVGGKLCRDEHASRVLPGYRVKSKVEILGGLDADFVYCVNATDLVSDRKVGLSGMTYGEKMLFDLKEIRQNFLKGFGKKKKLRIVITMFDDEDVRPFLKKLRKYKVYFNHYIEGYGKDLNATLKGYLKNDYVSGLGKLVIVTGVGGNSGKMGFILSQLYNERKSKRKIESGFAKFESFPIWNLPLTHPVNVAYEAATADIGDYNMIDKLHLKAYGERAVNYNRDIENFDILIGLLRRVSGKRWPFGYKSPTGMGVNMMKVGIVDDKVCRKAGASEVRRRLRKAGAKSLEKERLRKLVRKV